MTSAVATTPTDAAQPATDPREFEAVLEFRAMGTDWRIGADGVAAGTLEAARALVEQEEQRCSRFRADSALSRLNTERVSTDTGLIGIVRDALHVSRATGGAFDPAVGAAVIAAGYDRTFEGLTGVVEVTSGGTPRPSVRFEHGRLRLRGDGPIDLGGIAKGWTVDRVVELLTEARSGRWLVDAGGDIRAGDPTTGSCTPIAIDLTGLTVGLSGGAVATSSTLRRAWDTPLGRMHHIVSPQAGRPVSGTHVVATVVAPLAATADALATSMLVDLPSTAAALPAFGAEALIFDDQGAGTMTPGMAGYLI